MNKKPPLTKPEGEIDELERRSDPLYRNRPGFSRHSISSHPVAQTSLAVGRSMEEIYPHGRVIARTRSRVHQGRAAPIPFTLPHDSVSRTSTPNRGGGGTPGRRFARRTAVNDILDRDNATRRDAPFRVPLSRATRRSVARRRDFSGPRGASVGPRQWGREGGARRLHGYRARDTEARERERSGRAREGAIRKDGRGREAKRERGESAVGRPPSLPRERRAYNGNNHRVSRSVG